VSARKKKAKALVFDTAVYRCRFCSQMFTADLEAPTEPGGAQEAPPMAHHFNCLRGSQGLGDLAAFIVLAEYNGEKPAEVKP